MAEGGDATDDIPLQKKRDNLVLDDGKSRGILQNGAHAPFVDVLVALDPVRPDGRPAARIEA